jgi:hypothetical protein
MRHEERLEFRLQSGLTISVAAKRRKSHKKVFILSLLCIFVAIVLVDLL